MAEVALGAILGAAVNKLLDKILVFLQCLKDRDANLRNLDKLLQRLQPFVRELCMCARFKNCSAEDPARNWLNHLHRELKTASKLLQGASSISKGIFPQFHTSQKLVELNESISSLVSEAALAQWSSVLSTCTDVKDNVTELTSDVAALRINMEKQEQLLVEIAQSVTSPSSHFSKRDMMCRLTELQTNFCYSSFTILNDQTSSSPSSSEEPFLSRTSSNFQVTVGTDVAERVISHLTNGGLSDKWVGLWAMGGAGKTFAAMKVRSDPRIKGLFTGGIYWVTVSKDQPPKRALLRQLFRQIRSYEDLPDDVEEARYKVKNLLSSKGKVLLILDDVWERDILKYLDVISEGNILVTTRDEDKLRSVVGSERIVQVPPLSEEHSCQLFSWHAFRIRGKNVPSDIESVARDVAKECKGLPLALEVVGAAMASKSLFDWEISHLDKNVRREWQTVLEQLRSASAFGSQYKSLYHSLQLSVDNLRQEDSRLPDCFFYFAAFPEDEDVDIEELVCMWCAEGMVKAALGSPSVSCEVEAKCLLGLLIAKSMIHLSESAGKRTCKIHDVMRDVARLNLTNYFGTNATEPSIDASKMQCLYRPGLELSEFPEAWNIRKPIFCGLARNTRFRAERLSLRNNALQQLPDEFNAPNLRVMILAHNSNLQELPPGFFRVLSQLRVLNLSYTGIVEVGREVLRNLKSLVLLDLTGCWYLEEVSDEIDGLPSLETILLTYCANLRKLPLVKSLTRLKTFSMDVPCLIPATEWRERMAMFEKRDLNRILLGSRDIGLLGIGDPVDLHNIPFLEGSKTLEELWLRRLTSFPPNMMEFSHLKILGLSAFPEVDSLPALDKLPSLEYLVVCDFPNLRSLPESFGSEGAFPSIKSIKLTHLPKVEKLFTFQARTMKGLETLQIEDLPLKKLPRFLTIFSSVKHLSIKRTVSSTNAVGMRNEDLQSVFSKPNCFPNLETLEIKCVGELPTEASFSKLRNLVCDTPREKCPPSTLELEKMGQ